MSHSSAIYGAQARLQVMKRKMNGNVPRSMVLAQYEAGMKSYDDGQYEEALFRLEQASKLFGNCNEESAEMLSEILLGLGACQQQLRNTDAAMQYYEACLEAVQADEQQQALVSPLINLGLLYFKEGDSVKAMQRYKRAQKIIESHYCTDRMVCADLYHNIAAVHDADNDLQKALQYYTKSLRIREKFDECREQQVQLALTKENVALIWRDQDNQVEAIRLMNTILPIRKKYCGPSSPEYGNALFNLGLLHFDMGRVNSSLTYFEKCHAVRMAILGPASNYTILCDKYIAVLRSKTSSASKSRPGGFSSLPLTPDERNGMEYNELTDLVNETLSEARLLQAKATVLSRVNEKREPRYNNELTLGDQLAHFYDTLRNTPWNAYGVSHVLPFSTSLTGGSRAPSKDTILQSALEKRKLGIWNRTRPVVSTRWKAHGRKCPPPLPFLPRPVVIRVTQVNPDPLALPRLKQGKKAGLFTPAPPVKLPEL